MSLVPAVVLTNAEKNILWVNGFFTKMTGYTMDEAVGKKPSFLQGPRTEESQRVYIRQKLTEMLPFKAHITNYRKNGEEYLCEINIYPIFDSSKKINYFISFEYDLNHGVEKLDEKYPKSSLKGKKEEDLFIHTIDTIQKNKLYLKPDISLKGVSDLLNTNTKYLSQVINKFSGVGFFEFINQIRLIRFKSLFTSGEFSNLTIFGLAQECGFRNKSTFFRVFKTMTGKTPMEFYS
jgi:PAS domain S-box-containing protein